MDSNTIISQIAFLLFISMVGYYLFPQARIRKHRIIKPKHKQYKESCHTDLMMEKIMKAYNIKEEDTDEEVDEEQEEVFDEEVDEEQEGETDEEIDEEIDEEQEITVEEVDEVPEEVTDEEQVEDTDEEIDQEVQRKHYDDSRLTDYIMAKIMKAYNVKEETNGTDEKTDNDNEELEEESDEEIDEEIENSPTSYDNERTENIAKPVFYNEYSDEEKVTGLKAYFTPAQLPITLAILWFIVFATIENFIPEIHQLIPKPFSLSTFTILPVLFLVGLSGLVDILLKQSSDNLETTPEDKKAYTLNIFKILIGWGVGIYVFITTL